MDDQSGLVFGHTRLSIVDLSPAGHQPMHSPSGRYVVVYNGEIYNFRELRADLTAAGTRFRGHSDTEVLVAALDAWGLDRTLRRLVGMFAIAAYDRPSRQLHLIRDRLGEKPLYHGWSGKHLVFASELKALREHPGWRGRVDRTALTRFLQYAYVPAPASIYDGIAKLLPGTYATYRIGVPGGEPTLTPYWTPEPASPKSDQPDEDYVGALDARLHDTIALEMLADVPVGAFLSGGVDSSLIVAIMQHESRLPVRTFTIGFREEWFDEAPYAAAVAEHLGTDHTELYVTPDDARNVIPDLPRIYDEPFADSSQVPTCLVARLAARNVTVALSGDGGDELFGGYRRYSTVWNVWRRAAAIPSPIRRGVATAIQAIRPATLDRLLKLVPTKLLSNRISGERLHLLGRVLPAQDPSELHARIASSWEQPEEVVVGAYDGRMEELPALESTSDPVSDMMLWDLRTYLPDDILVKVDRATMAVSLESRAPFLDHRIAEFARGLPMHVKIRHGRGKWILRRLLDRYVPRDLVERPKAGFSVPVGAWIRGPLRDWAEELLSAERLSREGYFQPQLIRRRWQEHVEGTKDWTSSLWCILMFQAWLETNALD